MRRLARLLLASLFAVGTANAAEHILTAEPKVQPPRSVAEEPKQKHARLAHITRVTLAPAETGTTKALGVTGKLGTPLQIGFGRLVTPLASPEGTAAQLTWDRLPDGGQVAAVSVTSPEAAALRAGLHVEQLPVGAKLRFYPAGDEGDVFEATAEEVQEMIERNLAAGDRSSDAITFWSPVIEADTIVVEIEIPPGARAEDVRVSSPMVSHLITSAQRAFEVPKAAAACNNDVMCYPAWDAQSRGVARIIFTSGGSSFACSGSLVADKDSTTFIPYFLTANHCVGSQTVASTVQSYWFYRSTACNSGVLGASRTLTGGATLLYASANTDTSFVRFNGTPPAGVTYEGWAIGAAPTAGTNVVGIHHPEGDLQKISFGDIAGYLRCSASTGDSFTCDGSTASGSTFYEASWRDGITQPGSSGSALFLENTHYLIGQLYGGGSSCTGGGTDVYGRFDVAYNAALSRWLNVSTTPNPTPTPTPTPTPPPTYRPTQNYSDLWWNPSESGWGISITQHNSIIFAAWFVYGSSGQPTWVVLPGGTWTSPTTYTGDVFTTTGPPYGGPFDPTRVQVTPAGKATLSFSTRDRGVISYQIGGIVGTKPIQRQLFGTFSSIPIANYGDLWWNSSESGWGLSINQQYRSLFAVWYTYGADGNPAWFVLPAGTWSGSTTYYGTLYSTRAAPVSFWSGSFDPARVVSTAVGTMSIRFTGLNSAVMTAIIGGTTTTKLISRQPF